LLKTSGTSFEPIALLFRFCPRAKRKRVAKEMVKMNIRFVLLSMRRIHVIGVIRHKLHMMLVYLERLFRMH